MSKIHIFYTDDLQGSYWLNFLNLVFEFRGRMRHVFRGKILCHCSLPLPLLFFLLEILPLSCLPGKSCSFSNSRIKTFPLQTFCDSCRLDQVLLPLCSLCDFVIWEVIISGTISYCVFVFVHLPTLAYTYRGQKESQYLYLNLMSQVRQNTWIESWKSKSCPD